MKCKGKKKKSTYIAGKKITKTLKNMKVKIKKH